ncbi:MAG: hypothetical protein P1U89_18910 [Verrucomicrobiales bacterium]|nr:hypothetical protein [Verrucomicrobiales bacterium]
MFVKKDKNSPVDESSEPEAVNTPEPDELVQHNKPNVQILYETTSAIFSNQVIVNSGQDQIILDFSTGIISDHSTGRHVLPIQSRIAMTPGNAVKLVQTLSGVIQQITAANQAALAAMTEDTENGTAAE